MKLLGSHKANMQQHMGSMSTGQSWCTDHPARTPSCKWALLFSLAGIARDVGNTHTLCRAEAFYWSSHASGIPSRLVPGMNPVWGRSCCDLTFSARRGVKGEGGRRGAVVTHTRHGWGTEGRVAQPCWCVMCAVNQGTLQGTATLITPENNQSKNPPC